MGLENERWDKQVYIEGMVQTYLLDQNPIWVTNVWVSSWAPSLKYEFSSSFQRREKIDFTKANFDFDITP